MDIFSIASSSSGNSIFVKENNTCILIDAGVSKKRIEEALNKYNYKLDDIDAILITHEHIDHIKGLGALVRSIKKKIYSSKGTIDEIKKNKSIGEIDSSLFEFIESKKVFEIGDFSVEAINTSHDAKESFCYKIKTKTKTIGIITDLGFYDKDIISNFTDLDTIFIEANYNEDMLKNGIYPYELKKRILGNLGHLSNEQAGYLLNEILTEKTKNIVLCHISKENNDENLALKTIQYIIDKGNLKYNSTYFNIKVAKRDHVSDIITL